MKEFSGNAFKINVFEFFWGLINGAKILLFEFVLINTDTEKELKVIEMNLK